MNTLSTPRRPIMQHTLRAKFTDGGLATASGPKVIQLCYERLDRDLDGALAAIATRDISGAHHLLCHAQDIVSELMCMLDLDVWEHAAQLASIYRYVLELLTQANVKKIPAPAIEARHLLAELGDAFRGAAATSSGQMAAAALAQSVVPTSTRQFTARA
jgi:flagellar protein FliS